MSKQKPVVHLRVYKSNGTGANLSYDANGNVQNRNFKVTEIYDTLQWLNYLKHIGVHGFIKVDVEKVEQFNGEVYEDIKDFSHIQQEVNDALNPKPKQELTPDQKRIADLEAKLEAVLSGGIKTEKIEDAVIVDDLAEAREEYQKVLGKKGHHSWSVEQIREKIAEFKAIEVDHDNN